MALSSLSSECCTRETPTNSPEEEATHTCGFRDRQELRSPGNPRFAEGREGKMFVCAEVRKNTWNKNAVDRMQQMHPPVASLGSLCPQHLQASSLGPLLS